MKRRNKGTSPTGVSRYRVGGSVEWTQARKAWEDDESWMAGILLSWDGEIATVGFVDQPAVDRRGSGGMDSTGPYGSDLAKELPVYKEPPPDGLPIGGRIWITDRWSVFAFPDEDGNIVAVRPMSDLPGTVFERSGSLRLWFLSTRLQIESDEIDDGSGGEIVEDWTPPEYVYGVILGWDGVERFHIIQREVAEDTAEVIDIVNRCTTWGEVREMGSERQYADLIFSVGRSLDEIPDDDDPFDPTDDGLNLFDYPITPGVAHEIYLPGMIQRRYGEWIRRSPEGSVLTFPVESGPAIVAEMRELGLTCTEDVELLNAERDRFNRMK